MINAPGPLFTPGEKNLLGHRRYRRAGTAGIPDDL